jgi:4-amino-4-deoxy-L-arabinose transferase-like glycosyltransferase
MARERLRGWLGAGAALAAGLLLRLWFVHHLSHISGDSLVYADIAKNILRHRIYGFTETGPVLGSTMIRSTLIRLPGYPLFLAACFRLFGIENYRAVLYVQVAADLGTCILAGALAGRLFGHRAAYVVLWLAALCPFTANYSAAALTETLVLSCIALVFYGFARWQDAGMGFNRWLWAVAAGLAYGILLRPEQGLLAAAVVPAMLWRSVRGPGRGAALGNGPVRAALPVFLAAICVLLPLVPWAARNWRTFHVFQPLAPRSASDPGEIEWVGFERWYRTWGIEFASTDSVYWNYDGSRIEIGALPARAFAGGCTAHGDAQTEPLYGPTAALLHDYNQETSGNPGFDSRFAVLARQRIKANPICYYLGLPVARLLNMMLRPRTEMMPIATQWWQSTQSHGKRAFAASYAALNLAYLALAICGLRRWSKRNWNGYRELAWAMAASLLLRCALLLTLDNSEPRYTLEFFPVLFVWAGGLFDRAKVPDL